MNSKLLVPIGAAILIVGLFLPVATVLGIVNINLLMPPGQGVTGIGLVLAACAVLGAILALIGHARFAVIPAVLALALIVWKYIELQQTFSGASVPEGVTPEQVAQVSQLASVNIIGWLVMGLGAVIMLVAGALAWKRPAA